MKLTASLALAAVSAAAALAPSALGSPTADLASISRDYGRDEAITPCRFTKRQLVNARGEIAGDIAAYAPGLDTAIAAEIRRWNKGRCRGRRPLRLKIVVVQPKGGARAESVTIRNVGRTTIKLRGYALRDAGDHVLKLHRATLAPGRELRVVTGCRRGHRGAVRSGARYYVCRTKQIWDDAGDVVELLGPGGGLLSTRRYGTS